MLTCSDWVSELSVMSTGSMLWSTCNANRCMWDTCLWWACMRHNIQSPHQASITAGFFPTSCSISQNQWGFFPSGSPLQVLPLLSRLYPDLQLHWVPPLEVWAQLWAHPPLFVLHRLPVVGEKGMGREKGRGERERARKGRGKKERNEEGEEEEKGRDGGRGEGEGEKGRGGGCCSLNSIHTASTSQSCMQIPTVVHHGCQPIHLQSCMSCHPTAECIRSYTHTGRSLLGSHTCDHSHPCLEHTHYDLQIRKSIWPRYSLCKSKHPLTTTRP